MLTLDHRGSVRILIDSMLLGVGRDDILPFIVGPPLEDEKPNPDQHAEDRDGAPGQWGSATGTYASTTPLSQI